MTWKKAFTILISVIGVVSIFGFMQVDDDPIKKIAAQLEKWTSDQPQEKVYLQTDKPYYAIGEDIWFKGYVTIGPDHRLSALSNVLNVELIDANDKVKQALKLPLVNGYTWGDFALADTLQEGNYRIRAYTNWMRNAGDEYFFDKTITIGNAVKNDVFTQTSYSYSLQNNQQKVDATITYTDLQGKPYANRDVNYEVQLDLRQVAKGKGTTDAAGKLNISFINNMPNLLKSGSITTKLKVDEKKTVTKTIPVKATSSQGSVQFFPESGDMVNGVRARVAFKAVGADGLGADVKGVITDNENKEVVNFTTQHLGMGVFAFSPEAGKTYKARVTFADGSQSTVALPKALEKGYVLSVTNTNPDNITVRVTANPAQAAESLNTELNLVAQSSGALFYAAKSKLQSPVFSAVIPKSRFPTGIVQFTLFTAAGEPLNERLVFIQNPDQLKLDVSTAQQAYAPRQKVKININAKGKDDKAAMGSFSIAVTDESKVPVDETAESTILSNLLLTSDLKGFIEKPNYYFTNINEKTAADLDVLMLTQGYRRFEWKRLLSNNFSPVIFQPEKSLSVSGRVKTSGGKDVPRAKVMLFSTSGGTFVLDTIADEHGRFNFPGLIFTDSVKFIVQARNEKNKNNVEIELDNLAQQIVTKNKNAPDVEVNVNNVHGDYLRSSKRLYDEQLKYGMGNQSTIMLKEVTIREKKQPIKNSTNLNGAGNADQIIKSDQLMMGCVTLSQCLQGRLLGVIFRGGIPYSTRSMNTPMQLIVDGMYMEGDFLDQLNVNDVESVEVLRSIGYTAIYGSRGGGGVIVVTTKRGEPNYALTGPTPGLVTYTPRGYYKSRQFYSPDYESAKTNQQMADLRTTIFWKPDIITDKDGKASLEFFNADSKGTYRVVVEGIDSDGNLARKVYRYKVQ
jgi:hypothetical protein